MNMLRTGVRVLVAAAAVVAAVLATTAAVRYAHDDSRRDYLADSGWPAHGQGAYELADGPLAVSPRQTPVPIASLAKVMTAMLVLRTFPGAHFVLTVRA